MCHSDTIAYDYILQNNIYTILPVHLTIIDRLSSLFNILIEIPYSTGVIHPRSPEPGCLVWTSPAPNRNGFEAEGRVFMRPGGARLRASERHGVRSAPNDMVMKLRSTRVVFDPEATATRTLSGPKTQRCERWIIGHRGRMGRHTAFRL